MRPYFDLPQRLNPANPAGMKSIHGATVPSWRLWNWDVLEFRGQAIEQLGIFESDGKKLPERQ